MRTATRPQWAAVVAMAMIAAATPRGATAAAIVGDCDGDGAVTITELVTGVGIALGSLPLDRCPAFDPNGDGSVSIDELVRAVAAALHAPTPTPTPGFRVLDLGVVGGQPCQSTQVSFSIPDDLDYTISALRIDFCVDPAAFDVTAITCESSGASIAIDGVALSPACQLDAPAFPEGQVGIDAHGVGGADGHTFEPFDSITCTIPVFPETAGGDYTVRYRTTATTSRGPIVGGGEGTITVFGLQPSGRGAGDCCTADAQCGSGFCRGGDTAHYNACCESECAAGICNAPGFAGACCATGGLPDTCNAP